MSEIVARHPEIAFLETLAQAIVNGMPIKGMAFCLTYTLPDADLLPRKPYVAFYADAGPEMVLAMMNELQRVEEMRKAAGLENGIATTPVGEVSDAVANAALHCGDALCVEAAGHEAKMPHRDVEGNTWTTPPPARRA